jgi:hypothetical protein
VEKEKAITAQSVGAASTYCCRYALRSLLVIATEEDDDGNAASGKTAKQSQETAGEFVDVVTGIEAENKKSRTGSSFTIYRVTTAEHGTYGTMDKKLIEVLTPHKESAQPLKIFTAANSRGYGFDITGFDLVTEERQAPAAQDQGGKADPPQTTPPKAETSKDPIPTGSDAKEDIRAVLGNKATLVERYFRVTGHLPKDGTLYTLKPAQERQLRGNPDGAIAAAEKWEESLNIKSGANLENSAQAAKAAA